MDNNIYEEIVDVPVTTIVFPLEPSSCIFEYSGFINETLNEIFIGDKIFDLSINPSTYNEDDILINVEKTEETYTPCGLKISIDEYNDLTGYMREWRIYLFYRERYSSSYILVLQEPEYMDVFLYSYDTSSLVTINGNDLDLYDPEKYEPIGIVVIPAAHNVYGSGESGIMALKYVSNTTPDEGSYTTLSTLNYINNVTSTTIPSLNTYDSYYYYDDSGSIKICNNFFSSYVAKMQKSYKKVNFNLDLLSKYYTNNTNTFLFSPYIDYYGKNNQYSLLDGINNNAFSDFNGQETNEIIINYYTTNYGELWKKSTILNHNYLYVLQAYRFYTIGTLQGDWYIPTIAEIGYVYARFDKINSTINKINKWCNNSLFNNLNDYYISVTFFNENVLYMYNYSLYALSSNNYMNTPRPFLKLNYERYKPTFFRLKTY